MLTAASYAAVRASKKKEAEEAAAAASKSINYTSYIKVPLAANKRNNALFNNSRLIVEIEREWLERQFS